MTVNGGRQRDVHESEQFRGQRRVLEQTVPRMRQILRGVRRQLRHNAEEYSRMLGDTVGQGWVCETRPGYEAPAFWIYFSIQPGLVCLEQIFESDQPSIFGDDEGVDW